MNGTMKLALVVACLAAGMAQGEPAIKDGSLVGWWRFDNSANYKEDSSGYGSSINSDITNGTTSDTGGYTGGKINLGSGKSFTATLADSAPAIPGTTYPYYTLVTRFKSGGKIIGIGPQEIKDVVNDTSSWHFGCVRYQNNKNSAGPHTNSKDSYATILDPHYRDSDQNWINPDGTTNSTRNLEMTASSAKFFVSYSGKTVTIGGSISGQNWYGDVDEVMAFSRMLTKRELSRLRDTGETYVYCYSGAPSFASKNGWSCVEYTCGYAPGGAFGVAYIVDNGLTMTQGGTATFGADVANHVSLTLGRRAPLTFIDGNIEVTKQVAGNFNHSSAGTLTFYDLRLVNGKFTGVAGGALNTTLLDIDTPSGSAFEFNVASGTYAISSANAVTGEGILKKTGAGTLDLTGLTGAAKVVVTEGKVLAGPNVTVTYDLEEDRGAVPVLMAE